MKQIAEREAGRLSLEIKKAEKEIADITENVRKPAHTLFLCLSC
jgi:hypothetical protein